MHPALALEDCHHCHVQSLGKPDLLTPLESEPSFGKSFHSSPYHQYISPSVWTGPPHLQHFHLSLTENLQLRSSCPLGQTAATDSAECYTAGANYSGCHGTSLPPVGRPAYL
eukprot:TRINITY_DN1626_c1_g1_i13.p4 TRINITY_DN1626_c1_g1~~TRINITY_DN1626_c1_g1_i13.p4  ORF type:complete len:112 (-),score=12.97 TRINITY_DN1626_c1_g1_i13:4385-4720(-)